MSDEHYITNPEAIAAYTAARMDNGIKGILPDLTKSSKEEVQELGIKQVVYNMEVCIHALHLIINDTERFHINTDIIIQRIMFKSFNNYGVQVNIVLLNRGESPFSQDMVHPKAVGADALHLIINDTERFHINTDIIIQRIRIRIPP